MRGNFFTVDKLVCSYFNRQEYSIFYSAAFIHTFDRAFSSSHANLNAAKVNKNRCGGVCGRPVRVTPLRRPKVPPTPRYDTLLRN